LQLPASNAATLIEHHIRSAVAHNPLAWWNGGDA